MISGDMVVDTNIIIEFTKRNPAVHRLIHTASACHISRVSYIEFLGHRRMQPEDRRAAKRLLHDTFVIVELDEHIADRAAVIRAACASCKLPDAIILATAMARGERLVTYDRQLKQQFPRHVTVPR